MSVAQRVPLRVGLVGCGKIADAHVEQIARMPALARVVAVCDREPLMAQQLGMRYGIDATCGDLDEMLGRHELDVVHVATPPATHLPLAMMALAAGCHVYVEKPLAPTLEDCVRLVRAARAANKKLTVGHTYLFDPPALAMRELIALGVLGEPVHVESVYGYDLDGPFGKAVLADPNHWVHQLPGKLMQNVLDHVFNKLVEFVDSDHPACVAMGKRLRAQRYGDERDTLHDELRVTLNGDRVTAFASVSSHARPAQHRCRVYGTNNTLDVDYLARTVTVETKAPLPSAIGRMLPPFMNAGRLVREGGKNMLRFARSDFHFFAGLYTLLERFYTSILQDSPAPISDRDMLWVSEIVSKVIAQLHAQPDRRVLGEVRA
jgi:predicted dehydrogenase